MVLGKLPVPGRPTIWIIVRQGPIALAVGADGAVWTFFLSSIFSLLSLSLSGRRPDRLKYCLKVPLNPKSTNQILHLQKVLVGVVWTFLLSSVLSLLFLPLFGRRPDMD